jgi:hypothetical protein
MIWPPLIERELRVALRKQRPARSRLITASALAGVCSIPLFLLSIGVLKDGPAAGRILHPILFGVGLYWVARTPARIAGAFAEERRCRTLGLLFLSGLSAPEVFASKVLSAALIALTDLLAIFPMLALPFLVGGISYDLFLATVVCLPNLLLFAVAVGLLASVLTEDDSAAVVIAAVLATVICALPPAIYQAQSVFSSAQPSVWWPRLGPAYAAWSIYWTWAGLWSGGWVPAGLWANFGITFCWSALCLAAAAAALKLLWRECEQSGSGPVGTGPWRRWVHGNHERRKRLASQWLDARPADATRPFRAANPFVWLAARDRQPAALAWLVLGAITGAWLLCWALWRSRWPSVPNLILTAFILLESLLWITRQTAAKLLGDARHDGSYELLLTTPLEPGEIVSGGLDTLRCHFQTVGQCVLVLNTLMMLAGLALRPWQPRALFVYSVIWAWLLFASWYLAWDWRGCLTVMWAGLNSGRPALAAWRATGLRSYWWLIACNLSTLKIIFSSAFPTGSVGEVMFASTAAVLLVLALLIRFHTPANSFRAQRERRLRSEFRDIVREPVPDPDDRRFKKWDHSERFPWGSAVALRPAGQIGQARFWARLLLPRGAPDAKALDESSLHPPADAAVSAGSPAPKRYGPPAPSRLVGPSDAPAPRTECEPARTSVYSCWRGEPGPAAPLAGIKLPPETSPRPLPIVVQLLLAGVAWAFLGAIFLGVLAPVLDAIYVLFGGGTATPPGQLLTYWGCVGGCVAGVVGLAVGVLWLCIKRKVRRADGRMPLTGA